jgi:hypothetical protein
VCLTGKSAADLIGVASAVLRTTGFESRSISKDTHVTCVLANPVLARCPKLLALGQRDRVTSSIANAGLALEIFSSLLVSAAQLAIALKVLATYGNKCRTRWHKSSVALSAIRSRASLLEATTMNPWARGESGGNRWWIKPSESSMPASQRTDCRYILHHSRTEMMPSMQ